MGVYELSGAGSVKTGRTLYTSMNAGNQYGAMVPIASAVVTGVETAIGFGNIPQTYQDLILVMNLRASGSTAGGLIVNNNPAGVVYGVTTLSGDGSTASSLRYSNASYGVIGFGDYNSSTVFSSSITHYLNYADTSTKKTILHRLANDKNGSGISGVEVLSYSGTDAINSIAFSTANGSVFFTGTATLYGIRAVSS